MGGSLPPFPCAVASITSWRKCDDLEIGLDSSSLFRCDLTPRLYFKNLAYLYLFLFSAKLIPAAVPSEILSHFPISRSLGKMVGPRSRNPPQSRARLE